MLKPKGDRVVVKKIEEDDEIRTETGLYVVGEEAAAIRRQPIGVVVAVGPDVRHTHAGEMVLYQRHGGTEVKIEGVDLLVFKESEILAGIEEDAPVS